MRRRLNILGLLVIAVLVVSCATVGYKTSYVAAEKQWVAAAENYTAFKAAGIVSEKDQVIIENLFTQSSTLLDTYRIAVLSGEPTDSIIEALDALQREILIKLATQEAK